MRCTKPRQPALNENFNLPYGSHVKKYDTRLLIGRIAFLTCEKSDTRHLIGLHRFAYENLLCGFSVCKSQYVYNKYRILHGKCARTVFTHELWRIRNRTSERSERVRFLIQNNECVNTVQSTFHVVLCLLYTY